MSKVTGENWFRNSLSLWERAGVRAVFSCIDRPHPASIACGFETVPLPQGEGFGDGL